MSKELDPYEVAQRELEEKALVAYLKSGDVADVKRATKIRTNDEAMELVRRATARHEQQIKDEAHFTRIIHHYREEELIRRLMSKTVAKYKEDPDGNLILDKDGAPILLADASTNAAKIIMELHKSQEARMGLIEGEKKGNTQNFIFMGEPDWLRDNAEAIIEGEITELPSPPDEIQAEIVKDKDDIPLSDHFDD